jgi:serine/threonine-protein kinase
VKQSAFSYITILIILLLAASMVGCMQNQTQSQTSTTTEPSPAQSSQTPTIASKTYTNIENGFSCQYPADWGLEENLMGTLVVFAKPLTSKNDFMININIMKEELPQFPEISAEDYAKITGLKISTSVEKYQKLEEHNTTIGIVNAIIYTYTFNINDNAVKQSQAYFIMETTAYCITYSATPDSYDDNVAYFDLVLNSFTFE